ncbi:MAG: helix-turn-helix domain-containing protein [Patescibacteria group bacterium]|nr:helix-turn-helix domain-containing protein [Patescibacteria group bacterium]
MQNKNLFSLPEIAEILGISRVAVYKKVKSGLIRAQKVGRAYAVEAKDVEFLLGNKLSSKQKRVIDEGVHKTVKEYGEVLQMLGNQ